MSAEEWTRGLPRRLDGVLFVRAHAHGAAAPEPAHLLGHVQVLPLVSRVDGRGHASDGDGLLPAEGSDVPPARPSASKAACSSSGAACASRVQITLAYAKLALEMQELWLATRIRREEYGWVGDLRALEDARRVHTRREAQLGPPACRVCRRAVPRSKRVGRHVRGRASARPWSSASRPCERRWGIAPRNRRAPPRRCPICGCRAAAPAARSAFGRLAFIVQRVLGAELSRPPRAESVLGTNRTSSPPQAVWRLNPFTLVWNGARDIKNAVMFFTAMAAETY